MGMLKARLILFVGAMSVSCFGIPWLPDYPRNLDFYHGLGDEQLLKRTAFLMPPTAGLRMQSNKERSHANLQGLNLSVDSPRKYPIPANFASTIKQCKKGENCDFLTTYNQNEMMDTPTSTEKPTPAARIWYNPYAGLATVPGELNPYKIYAQEMLRNAIKLYYEDLAEAEKERKRKLLKEMKKNPFLKIFDNDEEGHRHQRLRRFIQSLKTKSKSGAN